MTAYTEQQQKTLKTLQDATGLEWCVLPMDATRSPVDKPKFLIANMPIFTMNGEGYPRMIDHYTMPTLFNRSKGSQEYVYAVRFTDNDRADDPNYAFATIAAMRDALAHAGVLHKGDMQGIHDLKPDGKPYLVEKNMVFHGIALPSAAAEDAAFLRTISFEVRDNINRAMDKPAAKAPEAAGNHTEKACCEKLRKATGMDWRVVDITKQNVGEKDFMICGVVDVYADAKHIPVVNPVMSNINQTRDKRFYMLDNSETIQRADEFLAAQAQVRNVIHKLGLQDIHPILGGYDVSLMDHADDAVKNSRYNRILLPASLVESPQFQNELNTELRGKVLLTSLNVNTPYKGRN